MKIRLKDIIDLDYFIHVDDALESKEEIKSRAIKDRKIYYKNKPQTGKMLLLSWLTTRREEFSRDKDKKVLLPGAIFSSLYTWMVYAAVFSGGISGISLVYSFLAYHGTRPINVAVFIALFVVFPVILVLLSLIFLARRVTGKNKNQRPGSSIFQTFLSALFFNVLPRILKKLDGSIFKKSLDTLEYTSSLIQLKNREYKDLFFWPFFILTSVFAFSFSTGALGGTFFRVIVSDMAFGWQSTLMATSQSIHDMISFVALPWSWIIPEPFAHPSLEQIEGSRIVLKDGISVLATQDLISWWPFICMGILFYAVIPRVVFIVSGILAQHHVLQQFDFERPRFKQLIIRMQAPVLDIDTNETPVSRAQQPPVADPVKEKSRDRGMKQPPLIKPEPNSAGQTAVILASKSVYTDAVIKKIILHIKSYLFFDVKEMIGIHFDADLDTDAVQGVTKSDADQVILLHEVWQPPIRGLLHYIKQLKAAMPGDKLLWILLTQDTGQEDLSVDDSDLDFEVWKNAVFKLEDPGILVKRFL